MYDVTELATAVKPLVLRYLLERDRAPSPTSTPTSAFFDEIDEIARLTETRRRAHAPRRLPSVPRDDEKPTEIDLLASGTYNLGFIALAPGDDAERLIDWWSERLRFDCVIEHAMGVFVDQRWFDLVASVVPRFHVLRDPGVNVAYWNLHERVVERDGDNYTVERTAAALLSLQRLRSRPAHSPCPSTRPEYASPTSPSSPRSARTTPAQLRRRGIRRDGREPWPYDQLADGTPLTPQLRRLYARGRARRAPSGSRRSPRPARRSSSPGVRSR